MRSPDDVRDFLQRRYRSQRRAWLQGQGSWPLSIGLGDPKESQVQPEALQSWVRAWQAWSGPGQLLWQERRWRVLGTQRLPHRLVLSAPPEAAGWLLEEQRWELASLRYRDLLERWPDLVGADRHFEALAETSEEDWDRLVRLLAWLRLHPSSGLYPRQIPVAGLDSKWMDRHRGLMSALLGRPDGLRALPACVRVRLLCPSLRALAAGFGDVTVPVSELAGLRLGVRRAVVVENLQTGLAFGDLPGVIVVVALGYATDLLAQLPWLQDVPCSYWGDLDTHGLAILNRARHAVPHIQSLLMDEATLLAHRGLWGNEEIPSRAASLSMLTADEHTLYDGLRGHRWGANVRLEQERIDWSYAWGRIEEALHP